MVDTIMIIHDGLIFCCSLPTWAYVAFHHVVLSLSGISAGRLHKRSGDTGDSRKTSTCIQTAEMEISPLLWLTSSHALCWRLMTAVHPDEVIMRTCRGNIIWLKECPNCRRCCHLEDSSVSENPASELRVETKCSGLGLSKYVHTCGGAKACRILSVFHIVWIRAKRSNNSFRFISWSHREIQCRQKWSPDFHWLLNSHVSTCLNHPGDCDSQGETLTRNGEIRWDQRLNTKLRLRILARYKLSEANWNKNWRRWEKMMISHDFVVSWCSKHLLLNNLYKGLKTQLTNICECLSKWLSYSTLWRPLQNKISHKNNKFKEIQRRSKKYGHRSAEQP